MKNAILRFNGKKYFRSDRHEAKTTAKKEATKLRKDGFNARVVYVYKKNEPDHGLAWAVYRKRRK